MIRISKLKFIKTKLIGFIFRSNKKYKLKSSIIDKESRISSITFNHKEIFTKWKAEILEINWIILERGKLTYLRNLTIKMNYKTIITMSCIIIISRSCTMNSKSYNK